MAQLVVGGQPLLLLGHDHRAPLGAHHDLVLGQLEVGHADHPLADAGREQGRLVDDVGEIGAREAGRAARDHLGIDVGPDPDLLHVHLEDFFPTQNVGVRHDHLAVEAARPQQRRIEHVRAVGRGDQDHALVGLEAVHLDQQLVEGLLALVVAAAQARTAVPPDRVDLVDEDDAGRMLLGLLEHVADAGRADAHEHLDEVRARDREERDVGLAGDRAREQGLAGAGRPDQQHALRESGRRPAGTSAGS